MDKRLLIVDDEVSLLEMLESFFHDTTDFTVKTASSGEEAVEILKKKRYPDSIMYGLGPFLVTITKRLRQGMDNQSN